MPAAVPLGNESYIREVVGVKGSRERHWVSRGKPRSRPVAVERSSSRGHAGSGRSKGRGSWTTNLLFSRLLLCKVCRPARSELDALLTAPPPRVSERERRAARVHHPTGQRDGQFPLGGAGEAAGRIRGDRPVRRDRAAGDGAVDGVAERIDRVRWTGPGVSPALLRAVVVLATAPLLASCGSLVRIATWDDEPVPLLVWFDDTECRMALGDSVHLMKGEPVTFLEATSETYAILQCTNRSGSLSLLARSDADAWVSGLSEPGNRTAGCPSAPGSRDSARCDRSPDARR